MWFDSKLNILLLTLYAKNLRPEISGRTTRSVSKKRLLLVSCVLLAFLLFSVQVISAQHNEQHNQYEFTSGTIAPAMSDSTGSITIQGPADGKITQTFSDDHDGTDIRVGVSGEGDPIYCAKSGTVEYADWENAADHLQGFGLYIRIRDSDENKYWYGHLQENSLLVKVGDTVTNGQQIAKEGNTGHSTGPHLHFRIHDSSGNRYDPFPDLKVGDAVQTSKIYTAKIYNPKKQGTGFKDAGPEGDR